MAVDICLYIGEAGKLRLLHGEAGKLCLLYGEAGKLRLLHGEAGKLRLLHWQSWEASPPIGMQRYTFLMRLSSDLTTINFCT